MKKVLFIVMLLISFSAFSQKDKADSSVKPGLLKQLYLNQESNKTFYFHDNSKYKQVASWKNGSDTLEVFYGAVNYIKIGSEVFKITSPSLIKTNQESIYFRFGTPNNTTILPAVIN